MPPSCRRRRVRCGTCTQARREGPRRACPAYWTCSAWGATTASSRVGGWEGAGGCVLPAAAALLCCQQPPASNRCCWPSLVQPAPTAVPSLLPWQSGCTPGCWTGWLTRATCRPPRRCTSCGRSRTSCWCVRVMGVGSDQLFDGQVWWRTRRWRVRRDACPPPHHRARPRHRHVAPCLGPHPAPPHPPARPASPSCTIAGWCTPT